MSPYDVQIDSLYFHTMKGSLLKGKTNIFITTLSTKTEKDIYYRKYNLYI